MLNINWRIDDKDLESDAIMEPAISHEDIILTGELKALEYTEDPKLPMVSGPVVEIAIYNNRGNPLISTTEGYYHMIFLYVDGFSGILEDFYQGIENSRIKGSENYSFGNDLRIMKKVANRLKTEGYLLDNSENVVQKMFQELQGFQYDGNIFPARMRVYLGPRAKELNLQNACLIYSHEEPKGKQDLSWIEIFRLEVKE